MDKQNIAASDSCPYCIVVADDHSLFRQDLKKILGRREDLKLVGEAVDGYELIDLIEKWSPHMAIIDISMPKLNGIEATRQIVTSHPGVNVMILTMHKNAQYLQQAVSAGARGYLLKDNINTGIFHAIDTIRNGGVYYDKF